MRPSLLDFPPRRSRGGAHQFLEAQVKKVQTKGQEDSVYSKQS
jgi:hypothetical protein